MILFILFVFCALKKAEPGKRSIQKDKWKGICTVTHMHACAHLFITICLFDLLLILNIF